MFDVAVRTVFDLAVRTVFDLAAPADRSRIAADTQFGQVAYSTARTALIRHSLKKEAYTSTLSHRCHTRRHTSCADVTQDVTLAAQMSHKTSH